MTGTIRIIKRYANRKLYDTQDSRYVTLDQISDMIRTGEDVKVVDNSSKEDLTSVTLAQIIFEEEKRRRSFLPLSALRKVIQSGGESLHDFVSQIQESAGRVGRVFRRDERGEGEEGEEGVVGESEVEPVAAAEGQDEAGLEAKEAREPVRMLREFIDNVQSTVDDWQRRVDTNVQSAIETMSPLAPLQKEMQGLHDRIASLEGKLREIEGSEPATDAAKPAQESPS
jgi:polyhydroxyalkanoate synthesis repressor PhaR